VAGVKVGVLASGSGTNLQALLDAEDIEVVAVASDKPESRALERARSAGVETGVFELAGFEDRPARDAAIAAWLRERDVELAVLAGYMALLTGAFLSAFPDRVINVHPSLLPAFPGIRSMEQALSYGAKVTGVTVHFVDEGVDTGAIIFQRAIDIADLTHPDEVHERLRPVEHELLPAAVRAIAEGRVGFDQTNPRRIIVAP